MTGKYPNAGAYQEAVQLPAASFSDPVLQAAEPEMTVLGLPLAITGAFAVVFPMYSGGLRWAVKCFLSDVPHQRERYAAVARCLTDVTLPYTAEFDYQPKGILVEGAALPILKMEWVEGISISRFIKSHLPPSDGTQEAAPDSSADSDAPTVAVRPPDSAAHPLRVLHAGWREMIARLEAAGIAHGDLQHGNVLVDEDSNVRLVDYDTMFVPQLKGKKSAEVGHRNYQHPDRDESDFGPWIDRFSALVIDTAILACIHKPDLWDRYDTGENLLFTASDFLDPDASPLFSELREAPLDLSRRADVLRQACQAMPEDAPTLEHVSTGEMQLGKRGDIRRGQAGNARRRRRSGTATDGRDRFERRFAPVTFGIVTAALILGLAGYAAAAAATLALAAVVGVGLASWRYRRMPAVRRRHRLAREEAYFSSLITSLEQDAARYEQARKDFEKQMATEYERRLEEVQDAARQNRLKHHFVGEAKSFEGITHKAVVRLKVAGIRTAYQATPERVMEIIQLSDETKANILMWRASLAAEYEAEVPRALSPAEERRVKRSIEVRLEEMDAEIARIRNKIDVQERERDQLRMRMGETRPVSAVHYLLFLLRFRGVRSA